MSYNKLQKYYADWQATGQPAGVPFTGYLLEQMRKEGVTSSTPVWVAIQLSRLVYENYDIARAIWRASTGAFWVDVACHFPPDVLKCLNNAIRDEGAEHHSPAGPASPRTVLDEAARLINGDRARDYGDANKSFGMIAQLWSAYLGVSISAPDVAALMMLLKLSRLKNSHYQHYDSVVDCLGYGALIEHITSLKKG